MTEEASDMRKVRESFERFSNFFKDQTLEDLRKMYTGEQPVVIEGKVYDLNGACLKSLIYIIDKREV